MSGHSSSTPVGTPTTAQSSTPITDDLMAEQPKENQLPFSTIQQTPLKVHLKKVTGPLGFGNTSLHH
jgi:hypothetical protein